MDSTGVHVNYSAVLSENCPFGSSRSGNKSAMAKRSHAVRLDRSDNSDGNVATSKKARLAAANMSEPKMVDEKPVLMNVPAVAETGDIGIISIESPEISSLGYRSCSADDKDICVDDNCIDDIFFKESVKEKLQFLSYMVGMDCSNPVEVLSEVVRVLRELNGCWGASITQS